METCFKEIATNSHGHCDWKLFVIDVENVQNLHVYVDVHLKVSDVNCLMVMMVMMVLMAMVMVIMVVMMMMKMTVTITGSSGVGDSSFW